MRKLTLLTRIVAGIWIVSALFFVPFTDMWGQTKNFLLGMASISIFVLAILYKLELIGRAFTVALEAPERPATEITSAVVTDAAGS
jgi:hypothetical protein